MFFKAFRRFAVIGFLLLTGATSAVAAVDPGATPVVISVSDSDGWAIVCTNRPGVAATGRRDEMGGTEYHEINSRTLCDNVTGTHGVMTSMDIDAQYDPQLGLTIVRVEDDLGQSTFYVGVCEITPGNLAVFVTQPDGSLEVWVLYVPALCSGQA